MKKLFTIITNLLIMGSTTFFISSCNNNECEHVWNNGTIVKESTCTETGEKKFECTNCDASKTETVDKLGHSKSEEYKFTSENHYYYCIVCDEALEFSNHAMKDLNVISSPTNNELGIMKTGCQFCGFESTRVIDVIPHLKSETYTYDNDYHWSTCTSHENCDVVIDYEKHVWKETGRYPETCGVMQEISYRCEVCEATKKENKIADNHFFDGQYINTDPNGHYHQCYCGEKDTLVPHSMEDVEVIKEASETETGLMKTACSVCNYESTRIIYTTNHKQASEYTSDETHHWFGCLTHEDCNEQYDKEEHSYSNKYVNNDEQGHYHICECGKKDEVISHEFTEWKVTVKATLETEGLKTKYCVCGYESNETEVIEPNTNFIDNFNFENADGTWKYGTVNYSWDGGESFTFTPLNEKLSGNDGWVADGVEIKAGWVNVTNWLAIAYTTDKDINISSNVNFVGGTNDTRLSLRIGVKNQEGNLYKVPDFVGMSTNIMNDNRNYSLKANDTIYFIFCNEAGHNPEAYPSGSLNITLKEFDLVLLSDFVNDFSTENADGTWKYGTVNYSWGSSETFTFTPLNEKLSGNDGWVAEGVEVKAGWFHASNWLAIAYTVTEDIKITSKFNLTGSNEATRFALRIGVKNSEGNLYKNPDFIGMNSNILNDERVFDLKVGDTIYFILSNEAGGNADATPDGTLNISIYRQ